MKRSSTPAVKRAPTARAPAVVAAIAAAALGFGPGVRADPVAPVVIPHFLYTYSYGTGLEAVPGRSGNTAMQVVAPGIGADFGTRWSVDYTPSWTFYSNPAFQNSLDQSAVLAGSASTEDWRFSLGQSYVSTSDPTIATGAQTPQSTYETDLGATDSLAPSLLLDLGASQRIQSVGSPASEGNAGVAQGAPNTGTGDEWSTRDNLHYLVSPAFEVLLGLASSYDDDSGGIQLVTAGPVTGLSWQMTQKAKLDLQGGVQIETFSGGSDQRMTASDFQASLSDNPISDTKIVISGDRNLAFSFLTDQNVLTTKGDASLVQTLWKHVVLTAGTEDGEFRYVSPVAGYYPDRTDRIRSYNLSLGTTGLLRHGTVMMFLQATRDASTVVAYSLSSRQIGFEIGYRY
jgi:hypothetical protein